MHRAWTLWSGDLWHDARRQASAGLRAAVELTVTINVLGVREDDVWCAIALEMSLRGYGETFAGALGELEEAIDAQISFAVQHGNIDQVFIPAEPHYFKLHADLKREMMSL